MRILHWPIALFSLALSIFTSGYTFAKDATLSWEKVPGAVAYEAKVLQGTRILREARLSLPKWSLDLPYGAFQYQVRAIDDLDQAGEWSETAPLIVMPPAPRLLTPRTEEKIPTFQNTTRVRLGWEEVPGIKRYRVVLRSGKKTIADQWVSGNETLITGVSDGDYEWSVAAVVESDKKWESEPSDSWDFEVQQEKLKRPELIAPRGEIPPPPTGALTFHWRTVAGVEEYELCARKENETKPICDTVKRPLALEAGAILSGALKLKDLTGAYEWSVRPLLSEVDTIDSISREEILITSEAPAQDTTPNGPSISGGASLSPVDGYFAVSLIAAPYTYTFKSQLHDSLGSTASTLSTVRISSEYWWKPRWGFAAAFERYAIGLENQSFSASTYEFLIKTRYRVGEEGKSWVLMPKAGLEIREMILVYPDVNFEVDGIPLLETQRPNAIGATLGMDARKTLWGPFSLGLKAGWHLPVMMLDGVPSGTQVQNRFASSGLTAGAQVAYFHGAGKIGAALGAVFDRRKISYAVPIELEAARDPEEVEMQGIYLFLSGILRF